MDCQELKSLKGLRILVAEDNFINQKLISHILMQWQTTPDIAVNGKAALEKVSAGSRKTFRRAATAAVRPGPDGSPDAGDGRLPSHPENPQ